MKLMSLQSKLYNACWYLNPYYFRTLKETVEELNINSAMEDVLASLGLSRSPMSIDKHGIAQIDISGTLTKDCNVMESILGFTGYEQIVQDVEDAIDQGCKAILFEVDSPGGQTFGCGDAATQIANLISDLPSASFCSGLDCSAAYFLSSSVGRKFASPSALTGSIGTVMSVLDTSGLSQNLGVKHVVLTGKDEYLKSAGMGDGSLSEEQTAHFQDLLNKCSKQFRNHVSQFRDVSFKELHGEAVLSEDALDVGLIDAVGSYNNAYSYLQRKI